MNKGNLKSTLVYKGATSKALIQKLATIDVVTRQHSDRLERILANTALALGCPGERLMNLYLLAKFHDIGKVGIPTTILLKPGPLDAPEYEQIKKHCQIGYEIAQSIEELRPIADLILKHHEWWNGQGYPMGLKGDEIPLECRILAIVDAYDAMTNDRPYRKAMSPVRAVQEIKRCAGDQFDPTLAQKFISLLPKVLLE